MDWHDLYQRAQARSEKHSSMCGTLAGYMMNTLFGMDSGTKADAMRTLRAGLKLYDDQQAEMRAQIGAAENVSTQIEMVS